MDITTKILTDVIGTLVALATDRYNERRRKRRRAKIISSNHPEVTRLIGSVLK